MHSSKHIEISKSSLVGLKAELLRKQEEVKKLKERTPNEGPKQPLLKDKKIKNLKLRDKSEKSESFESVEDDFDELKKSREVLEAKAKLYDKLKSNSNTIGDFKHQYLIDFKLKEKIAQQDDKNGKLEESGEKLEESGKLSEDGEDYESDVNSDPENDWVDFVDTLGRSRRCLRRDLPTMKARDNCLASSLQPPPPPATNTADSTQPAVEPSPELLSWDMQREMMRKKWEEQETMLLGKKDIHYQDVLYDEARPHGVGYFDFSVDEAERVKQQEALQQLRKETQEQQQAAAGLRARRQQQLDARLAAARRRKRVRLGLPPDEPEPQPEVVEASDPKDIEEPLKEESVEELKESIKKIAPVRPWDIGKDGVNPVMSQEEWVEMKREERPAEFAPPVIVEAGNVAVHEDQNHKNNFFTTKKSKRKFGQKSNLFQEQKNTGNSRSSVLESYKANYSKPISEESKSLEEDKNDDTNEEFIGPNIADITVIPTATENHEGFKSKSNTWKPSLKDIDDLLSQAKNNSSTTKASCSNEFEEDSISDRERQTQNHFLYTNKKYEESRNQYFPKSGHVSKAPYKREPSFRQQQQNYSENSNTTCISMIQNEVEDCFEEASNRTKNNQNKNQPKRKWAEIAPPPSMSYYINEKTGVKTAGASGMKKEQVADSITAGMSYLKTKTNEKQSKRVKGLLDFV